MAQTTSGIRSILSFPIIYNLLHLLLGVNKARRIFSSEYIRAQEGNRILDIGCGSGNMVPFLSDTIYYDGFDLSDLYIQTAKKKYENEKRKFYCKDVKEVNLTAKSYDLLICYGVLHHLDDSEVSALLKLAKHVLKENGRLVTLDGVYTKNQTRIDKWFLSKDRGQNIRTDEEYLNLCKEYFSKIKYDMRKDLSHIPSSGIIIECINA